MEKTIPYPQAYLDYLVYFHGNRDYFECHEVLEEYWKTTARRDGDIWVGLIQIAVGMYHHRRNNFSGASKMISSAQKLLTKHPEQLSALGLSPERLLAWLSCRLQHIEQGTAYQSDNLPLTDTALLTYCQERCKELGFTFGQPSDLSDSYLLHKHAQRDRSQVIAERRHKLAAKQARQ